MTCLLGPCAHQARNSGIARQRIQADEGIFSDYAVGRKAIVTLEFQHMLKQRIIKKQRVWRRQIHALNSPDLFTQPLHVLPHKPGTHVHRPIGWRPQQQNIITMPIGIDLLGRDSVGIFPDHQFGRFVVQMLQHHWHALTGRYIEFEYDRPVVVSQLRPAAGCEYTAQPFGIDEFAEIRLRVIRQRNRPLREQRPPGAPVVGIVGSGEPCTQGRPFETAGMEEDGVDISGGFGVLAASIPCFCSGADDTAAAGDAFSSALIINARMSIPGQGG